MPTIINCLDIEPHIIVEKFKKITGIEERRYAPSNIESSDMAAIAAERALKIRDAIRKPLIRSLLPTILETLSSIPFKPMFCRRLASRVKHALKIKNPSCVPYDILFGCPGWVQGVIQARCIF